MRRIPEILEKLNKRPNSKVLSVVGLDIVMFDVRHENAIVSLTFWKYVIYEPILCVLTS